jgi:putative CocE/NonD family hydrolase
MRRLVRYTAHAVSLLALGPPVLSAQTADSLAFDRQEVMIPMRDGIRLQTVVYRPRGRTEPLPILLHRTPYGVGDENKGQLQYAYTELVRGGYVFVFQNVRGRFESEGTFVMAHPLVDHHNRGATDESTDAYDTVDWLVKHVPNTIPKVGILGVSYDGWLAAMATIDPHPALKAASPQAVMADLWMGDDDFHQGAFRQTIGLEFESWMQLSRNLGERLPISDYDTYDWYLPQTLDSLTKRLRGRVPTWTAFAEHPVYDTFWVNRALPRQLEQAGSTRVPTLIVGGWWDQEDLYGTLATYATLERHDSTGRNFLLMGPWNHGSWSNEKTRKLGEVDFHQETGPKFREVQAQWFAYWLKDRPSDPPEALLFDGGAMQWRTFNAWPPKNAQLRNIYLRENGKISFDPPPASAERRSATAPRGGSVESVDTRQYDAYVSHPAHPVPYRRRPVEQTYDPGGSGWSTWLSQDQRFVHNRPDVLAWESEPLADNLTIAGDVVAHLFASTTGTDADWVVKLIDIYPDSVPDNPRMGGYQLMVTADIMRGRYWKGFSRPTPIPANTVLPFTVDLQQQLYTFQKGHRLMVQVQSSWFPLYDRNPQTFVPNIFHAKPSDFRAQVHRVWHTARYPSHVSVMSLP